MYEDAACSRPCGMEPMGCANCPEVTGERSEDAYMQQLEAEALDEGYLADDDCDGDCRNCDSFGNGCEGRQDDEPYEMSDVEADADTLASAGWGTDEDYGCYGGDEW